ncbi:DUF3576 domain-containing protein [Azospirillum sp. ST 5-10]|uniref:DUF3576 domain-containing protein n=1 Tax=unclassified Azospirillum TaxID=2630922 RepID=UPI003F49BAF8
MTGLSPRVVFVRSAILALGALLAACSSNGEAVQSPEPERDNIYRYGSLLGEDGGLTLFGGPRKRGQDGADETSGIGVNSFLWRASLDTLSFMPIVQADPFGGVVLTDWYSPPETPNERFKVNLYILDRQLRADGVRVSVFRQARTGGTWQDVAVASDTGRSLEDAILTRARQLRVAQAAR